MSEAIPEASVARTARVKFAFVDTLVFVDTFMKIGQVRTAKSGVEPMRILRCDADAKAEYTLLALWY
jgi:hypothetical protein